MFSLKYTANFSKWLYQFTRPNQCMQVIVVSYPCEDLVMLVSNFCHSRGYVMVLHCGFNLHFYDD